MKPYVWNQVLARARPTLPQSYRNAMKPYATPITQLGYHPSTFTVPHFYEAPSPSQYQPPPQPPPPRPPPPRPQSFIPQATSTQPLSHPYVPDYQALTFILLTYLTFYPNFW